MKKAITILLFAFGFAIGYSQNYQCFNASTVYLYDDGEYAVAFDSVKSFTGFERNFVFTTIGGKTDAYDCWKSDWPAWIGRMIDVYPNGDHIFYNYEEEPVLIKSQAVLGEAWTCYQFDDLSYVEAAVEQVIQAEFLGLTDSVKVIGFQAKDEGGNNISNPVNNKEIRISKNYGMIKGLSFKLFPNLSDFNNYDIFIADIAGLSDPEVGLQNLTFEEVFDFEPGDEFHVKEFTEVFPNSSSLWEINTVLDHYWIEDKFYLVTKYCARRINYNAPSTYDTIFYNDTITGMYNSHFIPYVGFDNVSKQQQWSGDATERDFAFTTQGVHELYQKRYKLVTDGLFAPYPYDCIMEIITDEMGYTNEYFLDGLGGPYWDFSDNWWVSERKLVYYKKANEEWGTPYLCDTLLTGVYNETQYAAQTNIFPNPVQTLATVRVNSRQIENLQFVLFNTVGDPVLTMESKTPEFIIDRKDLPAGIYFYRILNADREVGSGKLIFK